MKKIYEGSAGTLLYAVYLLRKPGIFGVPNVMPKRNSREFATFAQSAELELMEKGVANMDFEGNFSLEQEFAEYIGQCTECARVIGANLHRRKSWQRLTLYLEAGIVLERNEDLRCTLYTTQPMAEDLIEALELPEFEQNLFSEVLIDTDHLEKRKKAGILASGCSDAQAGMILGALEGTEHYAYISCVEGRERVSERLLVYNDQGILSAAAEYSETQEFLRMTPCTQSEVKEWINSFVNQKMKEMN